MFYTFIDCNTAVFPTVDHRPNSVITRIVIIDTIVTRDVPGEPPD